MMTFDNAHRDDNSPILVSGPGRSGSTWMQFFLAQHPRIHIHGQFPNIPWRVFWGWYQTLTEQGEWARRANVQVGYDIAHYAGSRPERAEAIFKRAFRQYVSGFGPERPRWGLKLIAMCSDAGAVEQWDKIWPDTRWIVCIRDPFRTISSAKNTFIPQLDLKQAAAGWVKTCRFIESHDSRRAALVRIDQLAERDEDARRRAVHNVLKCVGEEPTEETDRFIHRWPTVHKSKPDKVRTFSLERDDKRRLMDEVPDLALCMEKMGYSI